MRVLVVTHEASLSGAPRIAQLVARSLVAAGHTVDVVSRRPGPLEAGFRETGDFSVEPFYRARRRLGLIRAARPLAWLLDFVLALWTVGVRRPQLVYVNSTASAVYLRPALLLRRRVVVHSHESEEVANRFLGPARAARELHRTRLVACSPATVDSLASVAGVSADEVTLLPSVPDAVRVLELAEAAPTVEIDPHTLVVGCVGSVERRKGADLWPELARRVAAAVPGVRVRFVWIGGLDDPALVVPSSDTVLFAGARVNPYAELNRFDIAVLPSRDDPFPLVVMEAMFLAKPVVAFAVGGVATQLGDSGVLVPPGDVAGMAEAIAELVRHVERRVELGLRARSRATEYWAPEEFAAGLIRILEPMESAR